MGDSLKLLNTYDLQLECEVCYSVTYCDNAFVYFNERIDLERNLKCTPLFNIHVSPCNDFYAYKMSETHVLLIGSLLSQSAATAFGQVLK